MKFNFIHIIIIAIVGVTLILIWRRDTAESRGENIDKYLNDVEGQEMLEDEMNRLSMYNDIPPFDAYVDPKVEAAYMNLPFKIYYYNEDRLNEKTKQLLFGTGEAPIYDRANPFQYGDYRAPVAVSQFPSDVPPPNRWDYLSWLDTSYV